MASGIWRRARDKPGELQPVLDGFQRLSPFGLTHQLRGRLGKGCHRRGSPGPASERWRFLGRWALVPLGKLYGLMRSWSCHGLLHRAAGEVEKILPSGRC